MDRVLKGDMSQVTREFKFEELDQLWDIINSALQRIPKGGASGEGMGMGGSSNGTDEAAPAMRMLGSVAKFGLVVCDADRRSST